MTQGIRNFKRNISPIYPLSQELSLYEKTSKHIMIKKFKTEFNNLSSDKYVD
jgi:hypothetical protein